MPDVTVSTGEYGGDASERLRQTITKLDAATAKQTATLVCLTWVLVILTIVLVVLTVILLIQ